MWPNFKDLIAKDNLKTEQKMWKIKLISNIGVNHIKYTCKST